MRLFLIQSIYEDVANIADSVRIEKLRKHLEILSL
jgi:hypothetical protein